MVNQLKVVDELQQEESIMRLPGNALRVFTLHVKVNFLLSQQCFANVQQLTCATMVSALEMQYELMSHTVMFPLESPVINISLLGSVVRAKTVLSSSSAARYLPKERNTEQWSVSNQCVIVWSKSKPSTRELSITRETKGKFFLLFLHVDYNNEQETKQANQNKRLLAAILRKA